MTGILQGLLASIGGVSGGSLYSWGYNYAGRLGDNTTVNKSSPVQVGALTTWSKVSNGYGVSAAIKTDGTLWMWGRGYQTGQNDMINRSSPVQVGALTNWSEISAGGIFTVAIKTDGTLWSWGGTGNGQLGLNNLINRSSPVQIGALTNWSQVSAGYKSCAVIKTDGTLWTWGYNSGSAAGTLGDNTVIDRSSPVQVGALTDWSKISGGKSMFAAIKTNGTLWSWGSNSFGELGDNTVIAKSSPVQIGALTTWSQVACGVYGNFVLVLKTDGTLWSWGRNNAGQLGLNDTVARSSPVQVGALTTWDKVANVSQASAAIKTDKTLWTWGANTYGQLGDNTGLGFNKSSPIQVGALTNWSKVSAGNGFITAIAG